MKSYDLPESLTRVSPKNFTVTVGLKPEYVLKVNNIPENKAPKVEPPKDNIPQKSNPNPRNLPAVRVKPKKTAMKLVIWTCIFVIFFVIAAIITYKGVFYLFTI
jgi:hypothetical protein